MLAATRNPTKANQLKAAGRDHVMLEDKLEDGIKRLRPEGIDVVVELVSPGQCLRVFGLAADMES